MQSPPFLILAIFGFPLNTPLPTRHVRSPLTTAQRAPCQKRGFGKAHYQVAREARFRATLNRKFIRFEDVFSLRYNADSWQPKNYASNQSARVCIANCARFFILAIFGFPRGTPFPRDERSLTAHGPVRGSPRRARSFRDCLSSRARSAVSRDAKRNLVNKMRLRVLTF